MAVFVPDASTTLPWCFADEATPATDALLHRLRTDDTAVVPAHWPTEVMNGLLMAVRRGRVSLAVIRRFIADLADLPIRVEPPSTPDEWDGILDVAERYRLTAYDAAYLALASRRGVPLATLDGDLRRAAMAAGVPVQPA